MPDIHTDPDLLAALERATRAELTASEIHKQRVSFILGSLSADSPITREQVERVLERQEGRAA